MKGYKCCACKKKEKHGVFMFQGQLYCEDCYLHEKLKESRDLYRDKYLESCKELAKLKENHERQGEYLKKITQDVTIVNAVFDKSRQVYEDKIKELIDKNKHLEECAGYEADARNKLAFVLGVPEKQQAQMIAIFQDSYDFLKKGMIKLISKYKQKTTVPGYRTAYKDLESLLGGVAELYGDIDYFENQNTRRKTNGRKASNS